MKNLEELHNYLVELELKDLAQELAIVRYKALMWDKYNRDKRIEEDLAQAIEIASIAQMAAESGGGDKSYDFSDSIKNPHAHDNFASKDASGATYTGHDEEDIPGTARKGEN